MGADPARYSLVVSRGYVRLVREGGARPRRTASVRFVRRNGEWVEDDEPDVPEDIDEPVIDDFPG